MDGELEKDLPLDRLIFALFSHFEAHRDFYALLSERGLVLLMKDVILSACGSARSRRPSTPTPPPLRRTACTAG